MHATKEKIQKEKHNLKGMQHWQFMRCNTFFNGLENKARENAKYVKSIIKDLKRINTGDKVM